ncbi:outer membrane protein assembly factor BamE (lipoprotein component of BamABCDE complex) [Rhodoferax ferrireducens]|uniref:Outer membrane protein assembly factor BamE (Lipoprotein component of BamABCDE complex) n=1 Tax=Rhodoferax ferrireducens TaxID=192843 RepID=A0ABU2CGU9_9BURK|nr:hypothetical protein [Rhodoferax ferrireducens]MDR7380417.1 outer membrane protein assembly factor BamE (lipoprotein component of BamABCDE complex) [Rhodoferax ferrireducens]
MKNTVRVIFIAAAVAGISACGTVPGLSDLGAMKTGTQVSKKQMDSITDAKSTQADVITLIGQPNRKAEAGGNILWYYDFKQIGQAIIGKNIDETTVFEFNKKGVLLSHYKTGGQPGTSNNPLLKAAGQ